MEVVNHNSEKPHVLIMPSTGMGHLIPIMEFAKLLLCHRDISITLVTVSGQFPASALAKFSDHPSIDSITLPPVDTSDYPPTTMIETIMSVVIKRSLEPLRKVLSEIRPITAFVADLFSTDTLDVAKELALPTYVFFPSTATVLSFMLYLRTLHERIPGEYRDLKEPVQAPGCPPFKGTELIDPLQNRQDDAYRWFLHHSCRYREATGIMVNSFDELETRAIKSLLGGRDYNGDIPPVYPIGPLVKKASSDAGESREECLRWLDGQPRGSVLFVSFGSGGTMTEGQLAELALGLEKSGQRFLWVVRKPQSFAAGAYFGTGAGEDNSPARFLPEGFVERTAEVGLVVPEWAPQVKVLSHEAVGGFLSHCGWNSSLESVVYGVPMIGWPLYAEQRMNARMLADEIGISVSVDYEKGLVPRGEVERVVRLLMESEVGKKLRKRVGELKEAASQALAEEGSSSRRLALLADQWANTKPSARLDRS
ncbi:UDP-glycosyltransferase 72B1-like [Nymphaea colorata]|uniref:UDP-glycosyltransferase 72B1-like n=1 Tax=Nymphaea colorata TaxID=210225 RepID=UPI00129E00A5|nr:UDP-glycosyltransferase 72B1-like [Nymphaea colorata]